MKLKAYDAFQNLRSLVGAEMPGTEKVKKTLKSLVGKVEKELHATAKDHDEDDYYSIDGIFDFVIYAFYEFVHITDVITTSLDQEMITSIMTHVFDKIDAFDMDSVETFCANFDVIAFEADCVAHVSASKELILNLVKAPWMNRDIVYFWVNYLEQLITYDHVKEIVAAVMKEGFEADGTVEGALDAAKNIVYFVGDLIQVLFGDDLVDALAYSLYGITADYYYYDSISEFVDVIVELIDNVPAFVGGLHAMEVDVVTELGYIIPEILYELAISELTDDFHGDVCYVLGMVPVTMSHTTTCDFYQFDGIQDLMHEEIPFCLHPDYESYYAGSPDDAVVVLEGTMTMDSPIWGGDNSTIMGGAYYPMRKLTERKMDEDQSFTCTMTLGSPVSVQGNGVCGDSDDLFFFKTNGKGKDLYRNCKWLRNKPRNGRYGRNRMCRKDEVASTCSSTCCQCGEDPTTEFVKKMKNGAPIIWTCGNLAAQNPSRITAFCNKNLAFEGYASVTESCPETCGICSTAGDIL